MIYIILFLQKLFERNHTALVFKLQKGIKLVQLSIVDIDRYTDIKIKLLAPSKHLSAKKMINKNVLNG